MLEVKNGKVIVAGAIDDVTKEILLAINSIYRGVSKHDFKAASTFRQLLIDVVMDESFWECETEGVFIKNIAAPVSVARTNDDEYDRAIADKIKELFTLGIITADEASGLRKSSKHLDIGKTLEAIEKLKNFLNGGSDSDSSKEDR